MKMAVWLS